ncbi:hybrid sensor histidine kinase/response regulator transcription factor [Mucilaginibacter agri]|uniref:histidine kinase n=1 Tax=Mucilaginibacter agri TaxID=2695265 RepID=A0A966DXN7_9SPHI|nr:two-component regulator propeller domain-containing protein [Mucilaginibacter agri]NCD72444.1 response regulator [Mucilaginibacter agri]
MEPASLAVNKYTISNGLPSRNATAVIKGSNGFIWVGTENGLCKFDGYKFTVFANKKGDSTSISNNFINALTEDHLGRIWVGTMDGLNLFDPVTERFTRFYHHDNQLGSVSNNKIWSLFTDNRGQIWVGTDNGFNQYLEKSKSFKNYLPSLSNPFAMKGKSVNAIIQHGSDLWLGNWGEGLNRFDLNSERFFNYKQPFAPTEKNPNDLWALCMDESGKIWVGTYWNGLYRFDPVTQQFKHFENKQTQNKQVFTLLNRNPNTILVGEEENFWWLNTQTLVWTKLDNIENTPHGRAYQDKDGLIWIGAKNGLNKIDYQQNKFSFYAFADKRLDVATLLVRDSAMWLGTNKGLLMYDLKKGNTRIFKHSTDPNSLGSDQIHKVYADQAGKLWVLTEFGFDEFNPKSGLFKHHYHHSQLGRLFNEDVFRDIVEMRPGVYGLATDAGFKIFDSNSGKFIHYFDQGKDASGLSNNHLSCLLQDRNHQVWIGTTGGGLNRFDPATGKFKVYLSDNKSKSGLSDNTIQSMYLDNEGNVWICTPDGLNKYIKKTDSFITYSKSDGFASNVFNNMIADKLGALWVTTESGVSRFYPQTAKIDNFDEADGVFGNNVIEKDEHGNIYLAGDKGFDFLDPAKMRQNIKVPPVYISDFQIFNKSIEPDKDGPLKENLNFAHQITLKYSQSVFSIGFVALNYTHPEKNQYAYMLEGFDKKWNYVGGQQKATYTNLDPGTYTFRIKAANNDGVWNTTGKSIKIVITPPWYRSWFAYCCYLGLVCLLLYLYVKYREHQASLKYEIKLAHLKSEQETELNEKKLSFFTNVSHEFRTPLTLIINPLKELLYKENEVDMSAIGVVYRNARRLLGLVDQLLLFRKAEAGSEKLKASRLNISELCKEVFLCFSYQAKSKAITFDFEAQTESIVLYGDREKIEIVLFNLIGNALKFTPEGGRVSVSITDWEDTVRIEVKDTGCGIPDGLDDKLYNRFYQDNHKGGQSKGGFGIGLFLAKTFVEYHKGEINYQSSVDDGTIFTVKLLKGKGHLAADQIQEEDGCSSLILKELIEDEISANSLVEETDEMIMEPDADFDLKSILIIDDNKDFREYLKQIFRIDYRVFEAADGLSGLEMIRDVLPDIVISDVMMDSMTGIELCATVKDDIAISHIPFILLTSSSSAEIKLKGLEGGADDYISKPFDKDILKARVAGILKSKNNLQKYFYNEITLNKNPHKISIEYKQFLDNCIAVVEKHMKDPNFNTQVLAAELGISRSSLYKKIKFISGQSATNFIRFIRLRKAAHLFITTDYNILETSYQIGINDIKYFREQFKKLFEMNPSQYKKKYRKVFASELVNHEV